MSGNNVDRQSRNPRSPEGYAWIKEDTSSTQPEGDNKINAACNQRLYYTTSVQIERLELMILEWLCEKAGDN